MKTTTFTLLLLLSCGQWLAAQDCLPNGITFSTQAQIDSFPINYPGCTSILGDVAIQDNDITNLNGLNGIEVIQGDTLFIGNNPLLSSLNGLNNLSTIYGKVIIYNNDALVSTDGLDSLSYAGVFEVIDNDALISLAGFPDAFSINISDNDALNSLNGLDSLFGVAIINISNNDALTSLAGLKYLTPNHHFTEMIISNNGALISLLDELKDNSKLDGLSVSIINNDALTSLSGLDSLPIVGLIVKENDALASLSGLEIIFSAYYNQIGEITIEANPSLTSLNGFVVNDSLEIYNLSIINNDALASLSGLDSLFTVGMTFSDGALKIIDNDALVSLNGLENLSFVHGDFIIQNNDALTELNGLENLTSISAFDMFGFGSLSISENDALTSLSGLENLTYVNGDLFIQNNKSLVSLNGLNSLDTVTIWMNVSDNEALTSLSGLNNLKRAQSLSILNNHTLTSLNGLSNFESFSDFTIADNDALVSFQGLDSLFGCSFIISNNDALTSLDGLEKANPGCGFIIKDNDALTSLSGLENYTTSCPNCWTRIINNDALTSLEGLKNFASSGGLEISDNDNLNTLNGLDSLYYVEMLHILDNIALASIFSLNNVNPIALSQLKIQNCPNLSVCEVPSICEYLENSGNATISGNAPGCESVVEVKAACQGVAAEEVFSIEREMKISPNPASGFLNIHLPKTADEPLGVMLFDVQGILISKQLISAGAPLNLQSLQPGIYFLKVFAEDRLYAGRFIKQ